MKPLPRNLHVPLADRVRCLECGTVYPKPLGGGTVERNPGCPECGYVGWLAVSIPITEDFAPRRSAADRHSPQSGWPR